MIRRLLLTGSAVLFASGVGIVAMSTIGTGTAGAAAPTYPNGTDTVDCSSFVGGSITITPALSATGSSATSDTLKGELEGCLDGNGALNAKGNIDSPDFSAKVAGTFSGTSNNTTGLEGASTESGTITLSWSATAGATEKLADSTTVITVSCADGEVYAPGAPWSAETGVSNGASTTAPNTDGYGEFLLGEQANAACQAAHLGNSATETGGFQGNDSGASSTSVVTTQNDSGSILFGQASSATKTTLDIGLGAVFSG